jgi:hypothetical protein
MREQEEKGTNADRRSGKAAPQCGVLSSALHLDRVRVAERLLVRITMPA